MDPDFDEFDIPSSKDGKPSLKKGKFADEFDDDFKLDDDFSEFDSFGSFGKGKKGGDFDDDFDDF